MSNKKNNKGRVAMPTKVKETETEMQIEDKVLSTEQSETTSQQDTEAQVANDGNEAFEAPNTDVTNDADNKGENEDCGNFDEEQTDVPSDKTVEDESKSFADNDELPADLNFEEDKTVESDAVKEMAKEEEKKEPEPVAKKKECPCKRKISWYEARATRTPDYY